MWQNGDLAGMIDTRHEGTRSVTSLGLLNTRTLSEHKHKMRGYLAPLVSINTDKASWKANDRR